MCHRSGICFKTEVTILKWTKWSRNPRSQPTHSDMISCVRPSRNMLNYSRSIRVGVVVNMIWFLPTYTLRGMCTRTNIMYTGSRFDCCAEYTTHGKYVWVVPNKWRPRDCEHPICSPGLTIAVSLACCSTRAYSPSCASNSFMNTSTCLQPAVTIRRYIPECRLILWQSKVDLNTRAGAAKTPRFSPTTCGWCV